MGAIPPFGALYRLPTYVDPCLFGNDWVYFQAGSNRELLGIRGEDFERLEQSGRIVGCAHAMPQPACGWMQRGCQSSRQLPRWQPNRGRAIHEHERGPGSRQLPLTSVRRAAASCFRRAASTFG